MSLEAVRCLARASLCLLLCVMFLLGAEFVGAQERTSGTPQIASLVAKTNRIATKNGSNDDPSFARPSSKLAASALTSEMTLEREAFELVNAARQTNGVAPLVWDEKLCRMAREHSAHMANRDFFSHTDPENGETVDRARVAGVRGWSAIGENISYNQGFDDPAQRAVEQWLKSSVHRFNILYGTFTHSGIGVARAVDGRVFLTQVFIAR